MAETDTPGEDVREEYRALVREKEALKLEDDKLDIEVRRKQRGVVSADIVQKSLRDLAGMIDSLPLEDQKELFELLIREVIAIAQNQRARCDSVYLRAGPSSASDMEL